MKTFSIYTLGCKVNTYESEFYRQSMKSAGYFEVLPKEASDVVIINTCTVTNAASFKSRQRIHQAKRYNPNACVVVVGCYVQIAHEELKAKYDIDLLIGASHKNELVELIESKLKTPEYQFPPNFEALPIHSFDHQKKAYIKIQDGCNQFCAYCIIPYARGRERSLDEASILNQINHFDLHQEIVLTGIHTGRYGKDIQTSLSHLLNRICLETSIQRIRISSIEITEIDQNLIQLIKQQKRIARHLHIPLQAAHDVTLKAMNRPYDLQQFRTKLEALRSELPDLLISTDIIVGFPGETQEQFEASLVQLENFKFSFINVFPYSKRAFTQAENLPNQWSESIKKERVHHVQKISDQINLSVLTSYIGKEVIVLVEQQQGTYLWGYTSEYLPAMVIGESTLINTLIACKVKAVKGDQLIVEPVTYET